MLGRVTADVARARCAIEGGLNEESSMYSVLGGCGELAAGLTVRTMRKADDDEVNACRADSSSGSSVRMDAMRAAMFAIRREGARWVRCTAEGGFEKCSSATEIAHRPDLAMRSDHQSGNRCWRRRVHHRVVARGRLAHNGGIHWNAVLGLGQLLAQARLQLGILHMYVDLVLRRLVILLLTGRDVRH